VGSHELCPRLSNPLRPSGRFSFLCPLLSVNMTASANIPDGFSMGELELLAQAAAQREEDASECDCHSDGEACFDGKTKEEVKSIVDGLLALSLEECNDPMVHKIMALEIISNMIDWHTRQGLQEMEVDNERSAVAWTRDAGKFQAALGILLSISCGPNDWTTGK